MPWHEVRHRASGEVQHVSSLAGYPAKDWEHKKLARKPKAHERHVGAGKLERDSEDAALSAARARFNAMDKGDLMLAIEALQSRLAKLEQGA